MSIVPLVFERSAEMYCEVVPRVAEVAVLVDAELLAEYCLTR